MMVDTLRERNISLASSEGMSYKGYMKIDHLAVCDNLQITEAEYLDVFGWHRIIGVPDHSLMLRELRLYG